MRVIHATPKGTHAFVVRALETDECAVVVTTPYKASGQQLAHIVKGEK